MPIEQNSHNAPVEWSWSKSPPNETSIIIWTLWQLKRGSLLNNQHKQIIIEFVVSYLLVICVCFPTQVINYRFQGLNTEWLASPLPPQNVRCHDMSAGFNGWYIKLYLWTFEQILICNLEEVITVGTVDMDYGISIAFSHCNFNDVFRLGDLQLDYRCNNCLWHESFDVDEPLSILNCQLCLIISLGGMWSIERWPVSRFGGMLNVERKAPRPRIRQLDWNGCPPNCCDERRPHSSRLLSVWFDRQLQNRQFHSGH